MFIINTTTKKFTEAAELDLGMLPAQVKIDFALSDGSEPVEAENHRFKLTIGDVVSELYKTDEDTVSFRYVPFDSDTVAATKSITIEMDGEQILSDTIALTYSEPGGGNPLPSGGVAGQVLTKTSEGEAWDDVPSELPATGTDGNFLQKTASGAQWTEVPQNDDYFNIQATSVRSINIRLDKSGSPPVIDLEYSKDKINWTTYTWTNNTGETISSGSYGTVYFRGDNSAFSNNSGSYKFVISSNTGRISGNIMSLQDKSMKSTILNISFQDLFKDCTALIEIDNVFYGIDKFFNAKLSSMFMGCTALTSTGRLPRVQNVSRSGYENMFRGCTSLENADDLTAITTGESAYRCMFMGCTSLKVAPKIAGILKFASSMFSDCTSLTEAPYLRLDPNYTIDGLFDGCTSLSKVQCNITTWKDSYDSNNWLRNVAATGVFICPASLDTTTRDASHVPEGWTVIHLNDNPQSDWNVSDSTDSAFVKNKPDLSVYVEDSDLAGINTEIQEYTDAIKSRMHRQPICATALVDGASIVIYNRASAIASCFFQYSTDQVTWTDVTSVGNYNNTVGTRWEYTLTNAGDKVYIRGGQSSFSPLVLSGFKQGEDSTLLINISGDLLSLIDGISFIQSDDVANDALRSSLSYYMMLPLLDYDGAYIDADKVGVNGLYQLFTYCKYLAHPPVIKANHLDTDALKQCFNTTTNYEPAFTSYDFRITNDLAQCSQFFQNCSNLNDLTVHFTEWPTGGITNWLTGVSATGTFRCPAALDTTNRGANYIPEGWTIETF